MQCPQCHNDVPVTEAQYGALYTCPRCMAVYFINFDGVPEYGDMEQQLTETPIGEFQPSTEAPTSESQPTELTGPEAHFEPLVANDFETPVADTGPFSAVAQEIAQYGNQEEQASQINYDVFIKGLDTKEVLKVFKEAIDDAKFGWLSEDIMGQIKNGESVLKNLNPIQAFVLAQRIQFLDLDIEWKQNVAF